MSENHRQHHPACVGPKRVTVVATLVATLLTLACFFPFYQQLIVHSCISINHIAMRLNDEDALQQFLLINVSIVLKFLTTLLPIPLTTLVTRALTRRWRKLL